MADNVFTRHDTKIGTGVNDDFWMEHDGTNSKINNDTGNTYYYSTSTGAKTIFDDSVNDNDLVIDHQNDRVGIGTASPGFKLHALCIGENCAIVSERSGAASAFISGTDTYARIGAASTHPTQIWANALPKITIGADGSVTAPDVYSDVCGPTNIDVFVDSSGLFGANPSSRIFKENIVDVENCNWIYDLRVRQADYISGPQAVICLIAEEAESIEPKLIRYKLFDNQNNPIIRSEYQDIEDLDSITPNVLTPVTLKKKLINLETNEESIIEIQKDVILKPLSVNKSDLIIPLLKEIQLLKGEIEILKGS